MTELRWAVLELVRASAGEWWRQLSGLCCPPGRVASTFAQAAAYRRMAELEHLGALELLWGAT